jgi:predicted RNase H-like nuclease (RuvC/YqgF family)
MSNLLDPTGTANKRPILGAWREFSHRLEDVLKLYMKLEQELEPQIETLKKRNLELEVRNYELQKEVRKRERQMQAFKRGGEEWNNERLRLWRGIN